MAGWVGRRRAEPAKQVLLNEAYQELLKPYRHKAYYGGRGSAKSHSFATAILMLCCAKPLFVVCVRQFQVSTAESVKKLFEDKIKEMGWGYYFRSVDEEIRVANGGRIIFIGLDRNPDSIKSLEGADIVWCEEATGLKQRAIDLLTPTVRKPGSEIWWSWNPDSPLDPVDVLFRGGSPPPRALIREVSYLDNPYFHLTELPDELEALERRDPEMAAHVYGGKYRRITAAAVFKNWRKGVMDTRDLFPLFGLDFGFSQSPTAGVKIYIDEPRKELYFAQEAVALQLPIDDHPRLLKTLTESDKYPITADSARPESINYLQRHGFPMMRGAAKGPGSIEDGITWLKGYDIIVSPECPHTIRDLENYMHRVDKQTGKILEEIEDKFNDCIDAGRYATDDTRKHGGNGGFSSGVVHF